LASKGRDSSNAESKTDEIAVRARVRGFSSSSLRSRRGSASWSSLDAAVILCGVGLHDSAILRDLGVSPTGASAIYLSVQTLIAAVLLIIEPDLDFIALLFVVLSLQSVLLLSERSGYLWLLAFSLLTVVLFFTSRSPGDVIAFGSTYCAAYIFFGLLGKAVVESEKARETSEGLLAELKEKEASLRSWR
jgi:hypothetical protein